MDVSKYRDGRDYFRNSRSNGLNNYIEYISQIMTNLCVNGTAHAQTNLQACVVQAGKAYLVVKKITLNMLVKISAYDR